MPESKPGKFAIVPVYCDSSGAEIKFPNAIMTGDMSAVMARIKDSRQMREDLRVSNEADKVRRAQAALAARERDLASREASYNDAAAAFDQDVLQQLLDRIAALETQLTAIEAARTQQKLDALPDADDPASYEPSGELHSVAAKQPQAGATTDQGDLSNELVRKAPSSGGTDPVVDPAELAHPQVEQVRSPAAISLNQQ
jgi:hypothetical protein